MEVVVHQVLVVQQGGIHVPDLFPLFPVQDIGFCHIGIAGIGQDFFHTVLDAFHTDAVVFDFGIEVSSHLQSQHVDDAGMIVFMKCFECFGNGAADLGHVKINDLAIAFYHGIHGSIPSFSQNCCSKRLFHCSPETGECQYLVVLYNVVYQI